MAERVTMRDIAARMDVSVNTVHKVLTGKPGVSESLRKRVIACAENMGYRRNTSASNLRRAKKTVAVLIPGPEGEGHYYYSYLWRGVEEYQEEAGDVLMLDRRPYQIGAYGKALSDLLKECLEGQRIDGVLAYAPSDEASLSILAQLGKTGVPIELLDGDQHVPGRIGCMVADYATAGALMAEQAANILADRGGDILLLAGDSQVKSHSEVCEGFSTFLDASKCNCCVEHVYGAHTEVELLRNKVNAILERSRRPALACSVFAVGSEVLCQGLHEHCLDGQIPAIGSDLFPESIEALRQGTFCNLIYKDPCGLAFKAMETLGNYLLWGEKPEEQVSRGQVEMVFRSNLPQYCRHMGFPLN